MHFESIIVRNSATRLQVTYGLLGYFNCGYLNPFHEGVAATKEE